MIRAGSFDSSKPDWRGLIRNDGMPWYVCYHIRKHQTRAEAQQCAKSATQWMKDNPDRLPDMWITWQSYKELQ
jgi:hypothetical protein